MANRIAYTVTQLAEETGMSRDFIYAEIRRGNLPAYKRGKTLILTGDVEPWLVGTLVNGGLANDQGNGLQDGPNPAAAGSGTASGLRSVTANLRDKQRLSHS